MCWGDLGYPKENSVFLERFKIKNSHGKFIIQIAMDWGNAGGPRKSDYQDIRKTAWPFLFRGQSDIKSYGPFETEPEAQSILKILKQKIQQYWIEKYRQAEGSAKDFHIRNKIIQTLDAMEYAVNKI